MGPGPVQQPVNSVTTGRLGGSLLVGSGSGVSVKLGVRVMVGGNGVGVYAPAVWVNMTMANSAAVVPTTSTGVGVACGAQAELIKMSARLVVIRRINFRFTLAPVWKLDWRIKFNRFFCFSVTSKFAFYSICSCQVKELSEIGDTIGLILWRLNV